MKYALIGAIVGCFSLFLKGTLNNMAYIRAHVVIAAFAECYVLVKVLDYVF